MKHLDAHFVTQQAVRDFFRSMDFQDVLVPPAVENPGMETHLHPFQLYSAREKKTLPYYLHTSPEFHCKKLLSLGFEKFFSLNYCFRDEPSTEHHRFQFLMLEWYRKDASYFDLMDDTENLVRFSLNALEQKNIETCPLISKTKPQRVSVTELFQDFLKLDILQFTEAHDLQAWILSEQKNLAITPPSKNEVWSYDDLFFLLFLNLIEPQLKNFPHLYVYDYPAPLAALSSLKPSDPRVCQRFELYLKGVEIANCFQEETNSSIIKQRFELQGKLKKTAYDYELPEPKEFFQTMKNGLPASSGIALGFERLVMAISPSSQGFWN